MFIEKRKYPRISFKLPIKLSESGYDIVTETKNISGNGVYCTVDKELTPMTKLKIIMLVPSKKNAKKTLKKVICRGVVVRREHIDNINRYKHNIAIYFTEIKESDRKLILSYISSSLKETAQ